MHMISRFQQFLHFLARSREGSVLILFGGAVVVLFAIAGAGIDIGRQQLMQNRIQSAADAAAIATVNLVIAGKVTVHDESELVAIAKRYFEMNYNDGANLPPDLVFNVGVQKNGVTGKNELVVSVSTDYDTSFISNVGIDTLPIDVSTHVSINNNYQRIYDTIFVIDKSLSMQLPWKKSGGAKQRMAVVGDAITAYADLLFAENVNRPANERHRIALVFYSGYSNKGTTRTLPFTDDWRQVASAFNWYSSILSDWSVLFDRSDSMVGMKEAWDRIYTQKNAKATAVNVILVTDGTNYNDLNGFQTKGKGNENIDCCGLKLVQCAAARYLPQWMNGRWVRQKDIFENRKGCWYNVKALADLRSLFGANNEIFAKAQEPTSNQRTLDYCGRFKDPIRNGGVQAFMYTLLITDFDINETPVWLDQSTGGWIKSDHQYINVEPTGTFMKNCASPTIPSNGIEPAKPFFFHAPNEADVKKAILDIGHHTTKVRLSK